MIYGIRYCIAVSISGAVSVRGNTVCALQIRRLKSSTHARMAETLSLYKWSSFHEARRKVGGITTKM